MSISEYIRNHEELSRLDFLTAYDVIIALLKDGRLEWDDVCISKSEPER